MIRAERLTKYYDSRTVVDELSFTIADREIVGFLGLNGAGKTTSLRMLAGLLTPSSGRIEFEGKDLLEDPLAMQWRIGFLPEPPPLYEDMRVADFLAFAARLKGVADAAVDRRVEEVIELTQLKDFRDELIRTLSHGYRQRVGIAQAIVHDPDLVILDEPINGLDPVQIVEMRGLIRRLKEQHTVLLSSHILPEISQTCDRMLILHRGRLVASGTEDELRANFGGDLRRLRLTVAAARAEVEQALGAVPVVEAFEISSEHQGIVEASVQLKADEPDVVAAAIVTKGLKLRRLEPEKSELESMFMRLTGGRG